MLIVCPSCSSRYNLPDDKVGEEGRLVRCASCRHEWFVMKDASFDADFDAAPVDEPALRGSVEPAAAGSMWTTPADFSGDYAAENAGQPDVDQASELLAPAAAPAKKPSFWAKLWPARANKSAKKPVPRKPPPSPRPRTASQRVVRRASTMQGLVGSPLAMPLALLAGCAGALALIVTQRSAVVTAAPSTARLFAAVGLPVNTLGLTFAQVRPQTMQEEQGRFLVVEAQVRNTDDSQRRVPPIELRLIDQSGRVAYTWTADPPRSSLRPGESLLFRTRLATPPDDARTVEVRFATQAAATR